MRIKVAIACGSRLLCERLGKLVADDADLFLVCTVMPPLEPSDVIGLRSDVILIDRAVLSCISMSLLSGNGPRARFILVTGDAGESAPADREIAELLARSALAGIIPAAAKGRLLKKAVKEVASGELWLAQTSADGTTVRGR
jgi:hypothetical protein